MNLPNIFDWIEKFSFLRGYPAAALVLVTAVIIILVWDWRLAVFALAAQYFAVGLLYLDVLDPRLSVIKVLVGWFVCLILYITARQVNWGRLPPDITPEEAKTYRQIEFVRLGPVSVPKSFPARALLVAAALLLIIWWTQHPASQLPVLPETLPYLELAINTLIILGLLGLAATTEPLKAGMGLLMFLSGFELFYSVLEQTPGVLVLLAGVNLMAALVIAYLTQRRYTAEAIFD
jgi:hypothetical protein